MRENQTVPTIQYPYMTFDRITDDVVSFKLANENPGDWPSTGDMILLAEEKFAYNVIGVQQISDSVIKVSARRIKV